MPKINARKCPKTGKLFETDKAYRVHIIGLRKHLNEKRPGKIRRRECMQRRKRLMTEVRDEIAELGDVTLIEKYVKNNCGRIMTAWNGSGDPIIHALLKNLKMEEFELDLRFSERVSNTHEKPRGGVTNWGRRNPELPTGYPGWSGNIKYTLNFNPEKSPKRGNLCLDHTNALGWAGIHTGTGGGRGPNGVHQYEFGVTMFLSDFEALKKLYFHDKLANRLDLW